MPSNRNNHYFPADVAIFPMNKTKQVPLLVDPADPANPADPTFTKSDTSSYMNECAACSNPIKMYVIRPMFGIYIGVCREHASY